MPFNPNPKYVVDGHEHDHPDSSLAGDGQYAPFYIFDTDAQDYVGGPFTSRAEAVAQLGG